MCPSPSGSFSFRFVQIHILLFALSNFKYRNGNRTTKSTFGRKSELGTKIDKYFPFFNPYFVYRTLNNLTCLLHSCILYKFVMEGREKKNKKRKPFKRGFQYWNIKKEKIIDVQFSCEAKCHLSLLSTNLSHRSSCANFISFHFMFNVPLRSRFNFFWDKL